MLSSTADNNSIAAQPTAAAAEGAPPTPNNNHNNAHSPSNSLCEGSVSPSNSVHSQPSTRELNSSQHSLKNETSSDDPTDFSALHLPSNIEMHPQNDSLSSSSRQQFIKRPLNAYMIWTRQERKRILTRDPKLKMNEVSKAMGEKWKAMSDKEKKPYFELARKFALEHKQALQDHPELTYAPSKKKGPKGGTGAANHAADSKNQAQGGKNANEQGGNAHYTPDPSPRSTTPRQVIAPGLQQNMFAFQTPLTSGMQIAQVLGVRPPALIQGNYGVQMTTPPATPVSGHSILVQAQQQQTAFAQPQLQPQNRMPLATSAAAGTRSTPGQMLDLYYTSLCQPAFPTITESPVNTLFAGGSYPPQYFLEQYNQINQQQQQPGGGNAPGQNTGSHF